MASHQTSESKELPPPSNEPTTVHVVPPSFTESPTAMPAYASFAFRPTTSSGSPGVKKRPSTTFTRSWTSRARGVTPRTWTRASVPLFFRGSAATTTTSGLTIAPPAARSTSPASSMTSSCSMVIALSISEVAPARRIIAFSSDPASTSAAWKPRARASMATNTPTLPAMPSTATMVDAHRERTLSRL